MDHSTDPARDREIAAGSQRMLMEAGYEPQSDWVYVQDLVDAYRSKNEHRADRIAALDEWLTSTAEQITRREVARFVAAVEQRDRDAKDAQAREVRLRSIYAMAGVVEPDTGHVALALRISELEEALKSYAREVKGLREANVPAKGSAAVPFMVGVAIGGLIF